jgi:hypothetical protein
MTSYFSAVDFGFRPIRPEDDSREFAPAGRSGFAIEPMDACPAPPSGFGWADDADARGAPGGCSNSDDDLTADGETLPDSTGFGARQREVHAALAAATKEASPPGPFHGSTLQELCEQYGWTASGTSATPANVWADVLHTLRAREAKHAASCPGWRLDPATARHMKYRATLIEWILEVCADFNFGPTTADLAVQYMVRSTPLPRLPPLSPVSPPSIAPSSDHLPPCLSLA